MNTQRFSAFIAARRYEAAASTAPALVALVQAENYPETGFEQAAFKSAAMLIEPYRDVLRADFTRVTAEDCSVWYALLVHALPSRHSALSDLRRFFAMNDELTLQRFCAVVTRSPPEHTQEFAPHLVGLIEAGKSTLAASALIALAEMRYRAALVFAEVAMASNDSAIVEAGNHYFFRDRSPQAREALIRLVRALPRMHPGRTLAVRGLTKHGLMATSEVPLILESVHDDSLSPTSRAVCAFCLTQISLDDAVEAEAVECVRALLDRGIQEANARAEPRQSFVVAVDTFSSAIDGAVTALRMLRKFIQLAENFEDLIVAAIAAKDWRLRQASLRICLKHSLPEKETVSALVSLIDEAMRWKCIEERGTLDRFLFDVLLALERFDSGIEAAKPKLEEFLDSVKPRELPRTWHKAAGLCWGTEEESPDDSDDEES